ncbi:MAG: M28 family peptidase [Candidatus Krumholzibacteriia bacterium]
MTPAARALAASLLFLVPFVVHAGGDSAAVITSGSLLADVSLFASPECAGRLPGTDGYRLATDHAAAVLAELGLEPGGDDGSWLQHLPMEANVIRQCAVTVTDQAGVPQDLAPGEECACRGFTGSGNVSGEVVFVGYGLSLPDRGYDDYAGVDVAGKIVLAFKQAPPWRLDDGEGWDRADLPRPKARTARDHGAAALLLISRPNDQDPQPVIASVLHGPGDHVPDLPAVQISLEQAARLCAGGMEELKGLQAVIDEVRRPASRPLSGRAAVAVEADYAPAADTWNVVGVLRGTDPVLKDEAVVVGGHLDHVGSQGEVLWPGANDNASGAAAVLGIARAFAAEAAAGRPPRRTVVFVLFAGEEQGLHGARFHAGHPVIPLDRTAAMINLDCVAHGDSIQLGGGKSQPVLWDLARGIDADRGALTIAATWRGGGADAAPFWDEGVPTLYFASRYSYTHLHRHTDTVETLNPALFEELVRLAFLTAAEVASGEYEREAIVPES